MKFTRRNKEQDLNDLVDYVVRPNGIINPTQHKSEILQLLMLLKTKQPSALLEIGTANGGTLFLFTHVASDNAQIISVDLPGGIHGGGYPFWKIPLYKSFPMRGQTMSLVRANSHHENTLETVRDLLRRERVDFLFIDGDHTYEGVTRDFQMYRQIVKPGGIIAFHDIVPHRKEMRTEVDKLWSELKTQYRYDEFVETATQEKYGIGVIYV